VRQTNTVKSLHSTFCPTEPPAPPQDALEASAKAPEAEPPRLLDAELEQVWADAVWVGVSMDTAVPIVSIADKIAKVMVTFFMCPTFRRW
jgi:hypothetical protein